MAGNPKDSAAASPDLLSSKPGRGTGVRRLNRVPVLIVIGVISTVLAVMGYTMYKRQPPKTAAGTAAAPVADGTPSSASPQFASAAPSQGVIGPATPPDLSAQDGGAPLANNSEQRRGAPVPRPGLAAQPSARQPQDELWKDYEQHVMQVEYQRLDEANQAIQAKTSVDTKVGGMTVAQAPQTTTTPEGAAESLQDVVAKVVGQRGAQDPGKLVALAGGDSEGLNSQNGQNSKRAFLDQQPDTSDYLKYGRQAPVSPFEVKAGTVIPATMIGGINSDLPGQILGQVSENVYDTATGRYLLVPQGAKLIGTYDNGVTFGQSRVLVGWQRIIYPDGSSLDLGRMPGTDESGYAGFKDEVDNHLLRLFSQAFLLSIFSAGVQLGQPQASSGSNYNSSQIVAAAIAQQMGELGMEIVRRNMDIAPTLEIRPGYTFNVMVTKDMIVRPWNMVADGQ